MLYYKLLCDWLRAGRSGDRIPVGARFSAHVQTVPGAHPASCTMGTGSFPGVESGRGVTLTSHPLLVPRSKKQSRAIPLLFLRAFVGCKQRNVKPMNCFGFVFINCARSSKQASVVPWNYVRSFGTLRKATICFVMSVRPSVRMENSPPTGRIFVKFDDWLLYEKTSKKFKFLENLTRIICSVHEGQHTFFIISRSVLLRLGNVSDNIYRENQDTHFMFNNFFFENLTVMR
jgi:hypothetical protein